MKKIFTILAATVAAFSIGSCNKADIETPKPDIKLNITVAYIDGEAATKAVKTGWENGDKINIWYEGNTQFNPDIVIKFNGSTWVIDNTATVSGNTPAASGSILFVYEGYNDLTKYSNFVGYHYLSTGLNLTYIENRWRDAVNYTYEAGTLSFSIAGENWRPLTEFQVVITGIDADDYQLKCDRLMKVREFGVDASEISASNVARNEYVNGVANADGAAFYFGGTDNTAAVDYVFTLKNKSTSAETTYTATGKSHTDYTFTAVKIDKSKFGL